MSTSIGNLAVYLSADTGQAEKKIAGFGANVDKFDKKMRNIGSAEPRMKGLTAAGDKWKRIGETDPRHRGGVAGGARKGVGGGAGQVVGGKLLDLGGLGDVAGAAASGGPWAAAAVAGIGAVTVAAVGLKKALDLAGEAEANRVAFETLTGSADKGRKLLADLDEYAARTAFSSRETAELGKQLLGVGVDADQVMPALKTFGDIAGTLGGNTAERMQRLTKAFGDVKANGRLSAEELNQFSEAGVNLGDALAKTMGKPRDEIKKLAADGEIGFREVAVALNSLVGPGGAFHKGADKLAGTWGGMLGQVHDGTDRVFRQVGEVALDDLGLKDAFGEGLKVLDQFPDVLGEMRPGLKFFGDHVRLSAKLLGDAATAGLKLNRILGTAGKAFFGPEMKQFEAFLARYKLTLGDIEKLDLQGAILGGAKDGLNAIKPYALAAADLIDGAVFGYRQIDRELKVIDATGRGTFKVLGEGFKAVTDPLDNLIAKLSVVGEILKDPTKALDLPKALEAAAGALKGFKPDFKFDFGKIDLPPAVIDDHAMRKRLEEGFGAAEGGIKAAETERGLEKFREAVGPMADAIRDVHPALGGLADALDVATGRAKAFGHGLDGGAEKLSAHLRDDAKKLADEFADPLAKLFKRADELDKMRQFGAIDDRTRALAFNAEADKLLKGRGDPARPAPAYEYGSQDAARLQQQATGAGPRDLLAAVRGLAAEQREAVRVATEQLAELRALPRPKVVKMGGE